MADGIEGLNMTLSNQVHNKQTWQYFKDVQDRTNAIALQNWYKQNAYNSPAAQMQRMRAAGLNPNLIYQNGGATSAAGEIPAPSTSGLNGIKPLYDGVVQAMLQGSQVGVERDSIQAQIDNLREDTYRKSQENHLFFTPLKRLHQDNLLSNEERTYYSNLMGMTPSQVDNLSMRFLGMANELKSQTQSNKNAERTWDILNANVGTAENDALRAKFTAMVEMMNAYTEAKKRGWNTGYTEVNYLGARNGEVMNIWHDKDALDLVYETFYREYKEMKWQSSNAKHILDSVNQSIGSISGAYGSFKPSKQVKSTIENLDFNYNKSRGTRSVYYQY